MGIRVLRIKNEELKEIERVKEKVRKFLTHPPSPL